MLPRSPALSIPTTQRPYNSAPLRELPQAVDFDSFPRRDGRCTLTDRFSRHMACAAGQNTNHNFSIW